MMTKITWMKRYLSMALLPVTMMALGTWTPAAHAEGLQQIKIFESGKGGYHTYRIPAIAITKKGTLLAFCEGRKSGGGDAGDIDLLLRRSLDNGTTWAGVQVLVDDGDNTCGNPCPIVDARTGDIVLLLTKNVGSETEDQIINGTAAPRTVWLMRSTDDGVTWSTPVDISEQVRRPEFRWYATGPCHGIQLANGRLIAPCDHTVGPKPEHMHSHAIFSDDGGVSWKLGGILDDRTNECTLLQLADGSLYMNMRNYRATNRRACSRSQDGGMTWTPCKDDDGLIEPVCQASVLRLSTEKEGRKNRILFANPASTHRENFTVRLSYDECESWPVAKTLWPGPAAYSDLVAAANGTIGCLYECGEQKAYETITLALFSLEWLTEGADR